MQAVDEVRLEAAGARADDPLRARRRVLDRLAAGVREGHAARVERALEGAQVRLGGDDGRRVEAEVALEHALAPAGARDVEERRGERAERVRRAREPPERARHDEAHRRAPAQRVELRPLERREEPRVARRHRARACRAESMGAPIQRSRSTAMYRLKPRRPYASAHISA